MAVPIDQLTREALSLNEVERAPLAKTLLQSLETESTRPGPGLEFERAARKGVQSIQSNPRRYPFKEDGTQRLVHEAVSIRRSLR